MNFIQRNPNDPKYQEFHDGEYEYWPMDDSIKTKSISIPAALVSGLELLAAAAAAGLLAVALAVMYVLSSPLAISENSAVINTNVYNNYENQAIVYTLSVLEAPEVLPYSILFWRSFSHWIGGMGVLVFVLAIIPLSDNRSMHLMRAEVPGPIVGKLVPKMRDTAKILYAVYTAMTIILIVLLVIGKMPLFDAVCSAFGTAGTGGFSTNSASIAYYQSSYIEIVISIFMLLFGINFNLYYLIIIGRVREALKSEELRWYLIIMGAATLAIAANIYSTYQNVSDSLRFSFFQVSSIMTTTGFATADFAAYWPQFSQHLLLLLMVIGASAGSTGGGMKVARIILAMKALRRNIHENLHPTEVRRVKMNGQGVDEKVLANLHGYLIAYVGILIISFLIISLDGFSMETNISAVFATFNNIGPGFGAVGPTMNYYAYSNLSKIVMIFNMLAGRLEIMPMLVLFSRTTWRTK